MKPTRHGRGNRWSRGSSRRELHSRGSSLLSPRIPVGCAGVATAIPAGSFFSPNLRACSQWLLSSLPPLPQIFFYLDDSDGALLLWWREVTNIKPSPSRFLSSHGLNLCVLPTWLLPRSRPHLCSSQSHCAMMRTSSSPGRDPGSRVSWSALIIGFLWMPPMHAI
ncbi:uncharacterized protein [Triticum aestivum]|uniref:uncharacterized protein isoform X2 n=1 Tax=Triticum aestivum TaxID=4565 RepID=UPI00098B2F1B|nr:uncharacterized protein LOC109782164 isoform X2 [Aegilops tauschii subsp. strangulata]XP_044353321.1 uncharacterized protein LOC123074588 isoform X2 [Triticum aestivum]